MGCTSSIVSGKYIPKSLWRSLKKTVTFTTKTGDFKIAYKAKLKIKLPELASNKTFEWSFYLDQSKTLEGSDIMQNLGMILNYDARTIQWGESFAEMPMATGKNSSNFLKLEMSA